MHRRPPQVPLIHPRPAKLPAAMQHAPIIPDDQIADVQPGDADDVLLLRDVVEQGVSEGCGFRFGEGLDVVEMRGDVDVHPARGVVALDEFVVREAVGCWV